MGPSCYQSGSFLQSLLFWIVYYEITRCRCRLSSQLHGVFFRQPEGELVASILLFVPSPSVLRIRKHVRNWWACLPTFHSAPERGPPLRPHKPCHEASQHRETNQKQALRLQHLAPQPQVVDGVLMREQ